jgi:hypothetical protein
LEKSSSEKNDKKVLIRRHAGLFSADEGKFNE